LKNITIFGGAFDPVHNAHIQIIELLKAKQETTQIQLIPTFNPPHKKIAASFEHRVNMLKILYKDDKKIFINPVESETDGKSYSYNLLKRIKANNPDSSLSLAIGGDSYSNFKSWFRWKDILTLCRLLVFSRAHIDTQQDVKAKIMPFKIIDVSSTDIKKQLKEDKKPYFLHPTIYQYIKNNNLYE
jgi:nicotinate-nucleotide adenylyltransferase